MARHKISGYISNLWKALFAPFIQLFARIFGSSNTTTKQQQQQQQQPSQTAAANFSDSHSPSPSHSFQPLPPEPTSTSRHSIPDLEKGSPNQDEQDMAASKKRGGQKRSAVKTNGAAPAPIDAAAASIGQDRDKENISPAKQPNQPSASSSAGTDSQGGKNDARGNSKQLGGQKPNGPKTSGQNRGRSSPTKQRADNARTDIPVSGRETQKLTASQTPVITAVVPAENKSGVQKAGSHILSGTQVPDPLAKSSSEENNITAIPAWIDQTAAEVNRLSLGDKAVPLEKELTKDTAAVEAAAIPTLVTPKPLAPLVTPPSQVLPGLIEPDTEEGKIERAKHLGFMKEALGMGQLALDTNETPVGCVLVYRGRTIAKGMNATNITRNGTRHAEFMALSALLSHQPDADVKDESTLDESMWGDVDAKDGHIYPYGQKLHPSPKVDRSIISECILYVTVEPCVMCASLLRQLNIKKVYFGAVNDKFGGTGGVFRIHVNSKPVPKPVDRPYQNGYGPHDADRIYRGRAAALVRDEDDGDGGNVEPGYPAEGGYLRDEAVSLLRRFYVQENGRAPQPRKKEGRAARLFAMENAATCGASSSDPETPVDAEPPLAEKDGFSDPPRTLPQHNTAVA